MASFVLKAFAAYLAKTTLDKDYQYKNFNGHAYLVTKSAQVLGFHF